MDVRVGDGSTVVFSEQFGFLQGSALEGSEKKFPEGSVGVEIDEGVYDAVKRRAELSPDYHSSGDT